MKSKISFVCQECGYDSPAYMGKCPECGNWNSFKEFKTSGTSASKSSNTSTASFAQIRPQTLKEISSTQKERIITGIGELDGVLGGGIVRGSVILLAGDPGIGKSTLLLQLGLSLANGTSPSYKVLYISGEESAEQIKLRADRIGGKKQSDSFFLAALTNTDRAVEIIEEAKPSLVIIDSIQTMESEHAGGLSGAVGQIRYATQAFIRVAKQNGIPTILVGHVTKEGMVAGPMVLSHMVDTVLFFEGEKQTNTRVLRSLKNRFGPVDEVGIFSMEGEGITEIKSPQNLFVSQEDKPMPGSVLTATLEGSRAFLIEIQALAVLSKLPMPRRVASGVDGRRLELLLAVLQKHCNVPVGAMDVFVNVAGGLKVSDPACDLAICLAIYSSYKNVALGKMVALAEVGLLGELRPVPGLDKRIKEAKKLGFSRVVSAKSGKYLAQVIKSLV